VLVPAAGISRPEQEQQHAADQIEVRVRGCEREVLLDAHHDAGKHSGQQNYRAYTHHQRSDHP